MAAQLRTYYPQESVPDDQVLIEFDGNQEAEQFRSWWREEGSRLFSQYVQEADWADPWEDEL